MEYLAFRIGCALIRIGQPSKLRRALQNLAALAVVYGVPRFHRRVAANLRYVGCQQITVKTPRKRKSFSFRRRGSRPRLKEHVQSREGWEEGEREFSISVARHLCRVAFDLVDCGEFGRRGPSLSIAEDSRVTHGKLLSFRGGIIFVSAHLGNWEILGVAAGEVGLPVCSVFRPLDNPWIDEELLGWRRSKGQRLLPSADPVPLLQVLRRGDHVAFLGDRRARKKSVQVPFLGRLAPTGRAPALLSLRSNCPVVPTCALYKSAGLPLQLHFGKPIFPKVGASIEEEVERITREYTETLEGWVRDHPEQWFWPHRRWTKNWSRVKKEGRRVSMSLSEGAP